jgi:hypothetical protein
LAKNRVKEPSHGNTVTEPEKRKKKKKKKKERKKEKGKKAVMEIQNNHGNKKTFFKKIIPRVRS